MNKELHNNGINLLAKGLKYIPCPVANETRIRQQLLCDLEDFARRMRLRYIYHGQDKEPHPFHVKSTWIPPIQPSVALEKVNFIKPQNQGHPTTVSSFPPFSKLRNRKFAKSVLRMVFKSLETFLNRFNFPTLIRFKVKLLEILLRPSHAHFWLSKT